MAAPPRGRRRTVLPGFAPAWSIVVVVLLLPAPGALAARTAGPTGPGAPPDAAPPIGLPLDRAAASLAAGGGPAHGHAVGCGVGPGSAHCGAASRPTSGPSTIWQNLTASAGATPPAGDGASMAWDPVDGYVVLFGGCTTVSCPGNETWAYANGSWTNLTNASDAPPAEYLGAMTFDASPDVDRVVLFGGCGPAGCPSNQTWWFRGGVWTNVSGPYCLFLCAWPPPPTLAASFAYANDSGDAAAVLFGGCGDSGCFAPTNATWEYVDAGPGIIYWAHLALPAAPSPRLGAAMAYDPPLGATVLFGGCPAPGGCPLNDTWVFLNGTWSNVSFAVAAGGASPPGRGLAGLTWDAADATLLLVGGRSGPGGADLADTWGLGCPASCSWSERTSGGARPPAELAAMPTESTTYRPLLVGGLSNGAWEAPSSWVYEPAFSVAYAALPGTTLPARANVTLVPTFAGGTPPYVESVAHGDGATTNGSGNITFAYASPGTYIARATVLDGYAVAAAPVAVTIVATGPSAAIVPANATTDVGRILAFNVTPPTGGTPPYRSAWSFGDGGDANGSSVEHAYARTGTFSVTANVTDAHGLAASAFAVVTVHATPSATVRATPGPADAGSPVAFSAAVTGGTAPFGMDWSFGDGSGATGPAPKHTFAPGTYLVTLNATDAAGATFGATMALTVNTVLTADLVLPNGPTAAGANVTLATTVSGGTDPIHVAWTLGDGSRATGTPLQHRYVTPGTYPVTVWVNDSAGVSLERNGSVVVMGASANSGLSFGDVLLGVGLAILAVAVAVGALLLLRHRPGRTGPAAVPPPGATAGAGGPSPAPGDSPSPPT